MPYAVKISTKKNPQFTRCLPLFATETEAKEYAPWLLKRHRFIRDAQVCWVNGPVNAIFRDGAVTVMADDEPEPEPEMADDDEEAA